jgi:hypothetical protein
VLEFGDFYEEMDNRLRPLRKTALLEIAAGLCEEMKLPRPHRLAPRHRPSLICWFCRYVPDYTPGMSTEHANQAKQEPVLETRKTEENTQEFEFLPVDMGFQDDNGWFDSFVNF